jgi:hypothetical protein
LYDFFCFLTPGIKLGVKIDRQCVFNRSLGYTYGVVEIYRRYITLWQ